LPQRVVVTYSDICHTVSGNILVSRPLYSKFNYTHLEVPPS
jgi:hypothetical protein